MFVESLALSAADSPRGFANYLPPTVSTESICCTEYEREIPVDMHTDCIFH